MVVVEKMHVEAKMKLEFVIDWQASNTVVMLTLIK
jgi:hypothetical protein